MAERLGRRGTYLAGIAVLAGAYYGAAKLGHGAGYHYPHDDPRGWVEQDYRPPEAAGHTYYEPSPHGFEQEIATRMASHRPEAKKASDDGRE